MKVKIILLISRKKSDTTQKFEVSQKTQIIYECRRRRVVAYLWELWMNLKLQLLSDVLKSMDLLNSLFDFLSAISIYLVHHYMWSIREITPRQPGKLVDPNTEKTYPKRLNSNSLNLRNMPAITGVLERFIRRRYKAPVSSSLISYENGS